MQIKRLQHNRGISLRKAFHLTTFLDSLNASVAHLELKV